MYNIIKNIGLTLAVASLLSMTGGCKKLLGLELQQNVDHPTHTIDPRLNRTAWDYIKARALGSPDSVFYKFYLAIQYSGIDTNEYTKPGRTFILLHNDAVQRFVSNKITTDCYWGHYLVGGSPATSWQNYSPAQVKAWLQYLIVQGNYNYNFGSSINAPDLTILNNLNVTATTLLPPGTDTLNPTSIMLLSLTNDRNSSVQLNNFLGSAYYVTMSTAGYIVTNGSAHVANRVVYYQSNN